MYTIYMEGYWCLDYGNFKSTDRVARIVGSIFYSYLISDIYSWLQAPSTRIIGVLVASSLNGHCPISFSAVVVALSNTFAMLGMLQPALRFLVPSTRRLTYM